MYMIYLITSNMHNQYIPLLLNKIKKKTEELDYLNLILSDNAATINDKMLDILKDCDLEYSEYINMCSQNAKLRSPPDTNTSNSLFESDDINKMYKTLLCKSHPDRHINEQNHDPSYNENDFVDITKAYDKSDAKTLLEFAVKYNCDIDGKNTMLILEKQYCSIKNNVKKIKSGWEYQLLINNDDRVFRQFIYIYKEHIKLESENANLKQTLEQLELKYKNLKQKKIGRADIDKKE